MISVTVTVMKYTLQQGYLFSFKLFYNFLFFSKFKAIVVTKIIISKK